MALSVALLMVALLHVLMPYMGPSVVGARGKTFMIVLDDDPVVTYKTNQYDIMSADDAQKYKEKVISRHDIFLESLRLPTGSYTKLYSYTHLLNGFAIHATSDEALEILGDANGVRAIQEDIKMVKMTTHTPEYLGLQASVWPELGGAEKSGEGVVIGVIDTGINPNHPSFANPWSQPAPKLPRYKGRCESGAEFPLTACNGKIVGAQHFARGAIAAGDFNASRDYASPFDADGHGSHTASIAAGNYRVAVLSNDYNYGYASGMAPAARIAVYKALYSFGGYMSDVVAAVDKAVEDGVDIVSVSMGPASVPTGPAAFLNILDIQLLFATKAGVTVVQSVGNQGPASSSVLSFSPWITSVGASSTDRLYNNSVVLGSGQGISGIGLSPPTPDEQLFPIAAAEDLCGRNTSFVALRDCQSPEPFIQTLVHGKLIICTLSSDRTDPASTTTAIASIINTIQQIGAAGVIIAVDHDIDSDPSAISTSDFQVPGILLASTEASGVLLDYYNSNTVRGINGGVISYGATGRILDGRHAIYTTQGPIVASYSSRGPDVNNVLMQTADVMKPNIMAPGTSIWGAWSSSDQSELTTKGAEFSIQSGTSMATPHVAGIAALIKQMHPDWSPAAITSAIMTTAKVTDSSGHPLLAQQANSDPDVATPFDYGAGAINPAQAIDPGLVFDVEFKNYVQFLCAVPGVDEESVRRAVGVGCPTARAVWCSDLNTPSVTVANLVGTRRVQRRVKSVAAEREIYTVAVNAPPGVSVNVTPATFAIMPNSTRGLTIMLEAVEVTNAYTFGEVLLNGYKKHVVRIPLAIFVSSTLM